MSTRIIRSQQQLQKKYSVALASTATPLAPPQPRAQIAYSALKPHQLGTQIVLRELHMQRNVEWAMLRDLKLQRAQITAVDAQQIVMVADLFDQLIFIHRFYYSCGHASRNHEEAVKASVLQRRQYEQVFVDYKTMTAAGSMQQAMRSWQFEC